MSVRHQVIRVKAVLALFFLVGCQQADFASLNERALSLINVKQQSDVAGVDEKSDGAEEQVKPLSELLNDSLADRNDGTDFRSSMSLALNKDPLVITQRQIKRAKLASIGSSEAKKKYQITSVLYGGIEDITDNTKGIAVGLNAKRLLFDGGLVEAEVAAKSFDAEAAELTLLATIDERALRLGEIWLELEKYKNLQKQIEQRLAVLDPLIGQLEKVAEAGVGDLSRVAAAQRTVSGIRVLQSNVAEGLAKAQLAYSSAFGVVDKNIVYDSEFIRELLPKNIDESLAKKSPLLLAKYANYQAKLANLAAIRAKNKLKIGFEANALRPVAGSGYDSDESIGVVARKTLFSGGMLESEIGEAEAISEAAMAEVEATYREGVSAVKTAQKSRESLQKALNIVQENKRITADEIVYLRRQLIIGESTIDNVLSAEARLYDAESKEIMYVFEKHKAELLIASVLGLLGPAFDLSYR